MNTSSRTTRQTVFVRNILGSVIEELHDPPQEGDIWKRGDVVYRVVAIQLDMVCVGERAIYAIEVETFGTPGTRRIPFGHWIEWQAGAELISDKSASRAS